MRDTPHQLALPPDERAGNVRGAFAVEPRRRGEIRGRSVAVVDDVMTTGATLDGARPRAAPRRRGAGRDLGRRPHAEARRDPDRRMFNIVLVEPEIPPNTGNVIRLAANTGAALHLVEPLGFSMDDQQLRRAGLDYHEYADVRRHASWRRCSAPPRRRPTRMFAFTTRGTRAVRRRRLAARRLARVRLGDAGLPDGVRDGVPAGAAVRLPLRPGQRSLNLGNAVAVAVFEAWRQNGYAGGV